MLPRRNGKFSLFLTKFPSNPLYWHFERYLCASCNFTSGEKKFLTTLHVIGMWYNNFNSPPPTRPIDLLIKFGFSNPFPESQATWSSHWSVNSIALHWHLHKDPDGDCENLFPTLFSFCTWNLTYVHILNLQLVREEAHERWNYNCFPLFRKAQY